VQSVHVISCDSSKRCRGEEWKRNTTDCFANTVVREGGDFWLLVYSYHLQVITSCPSYLIKPKLSDLGESMHP
jgi:hypothetical protein